MTPNSPPGVPGPPGPQGPPGPPSTPSEPLEQRIYELLAPLRDLDHAHHHRGKYGTRAPLYYSSKDEAKLLILCENIVFLIRHNQNTYGKRIEPSDVLIAVKNLDALSTGRGRVSIGVFVNAGTGYTSCVVRVVVGDRESTVEKLAESVEVELEPFFPEPIKRE